MVSGVIKIYNFKILFGVILLIILPGCASYSLDKAQFDLRTAFTAGEFQAVQKDLKKFKKKKIYKSKDAVLFSLESGTISHFSGDYKSSVKHFSDAEKNIEDNYTKSISRGIGAFVVNDNKLVYDGEPYEDIYVNAFNALNFIKLGDLDAALVEARRMSFKMEQVDIRLKGLIDAFARSDTSGQVDWESKTLNIQNSAFSHYLATILFAKTNKSDDARIEAEKLAFARAEQSKLQGYKVSALSDYSFLLDETQFNVLITGFSGQAPIKLQEDARIFFPALSSKKKGDFYLKFSFPVLDLYPSKVSRIRVVIDNREEIHLELVEEMDLVAAQVYEAKQPIIYGRALLRAGFKAVGSKLLVDSMHEVNEDLGSILNILNIFGQELSEKADLRGWQTLPGAVWALPVLLSSGTHTIRYEYLSERGRILYSEEHEIFIQPDTRLELVESIYSN